MAPRLSTRLLALRLAAARAGLGACVAVSGLLLAAAAWLWLSIQPRPALEPAPLAAPWAGPAAGAPHPAPDLGPFYRALGERPYVEQQVATLFALAAKSGLELSQGEYKAGYDAAARVHTYRIDLPVKGSYGALWQFCTRAMLAIPFASLDELGFRRDAVGDQTLDAHLRFTLYLNDAKEGP